MKILLPKENDNTRPLYIFLNGISEELRSKIHDKFQSYMQHGDVYHTKQLKTLNSRIWNYKGTIYKLRVDSDQESARVLFARSKDGNLVMIHAFLKSTRKTPAKEAKQAISIYQTLERFETVIWGAQSTLCQ